MDTQQSFDAGRNTPAPDYVSPIKGTARKRLTVTVGPGQMSGAEAAARLGCNRD